MSSKQLYYVFVGLIVLLFVGLLGGVYGTNKLLTSQASKLTALKTKSLAQDQEQATLKKAKKQIAQYTDLNKIAQSVVPQDKNQAEAVREIVNLAADNDVQLASISFPASTLGNTASGAAAASTSATTATPSVAATATTDKASALSQLTPVKTMPGVYQLTINILSTSKAVKYNQLINFLHALEQNRRTAQVTAITIQPSTDDPSVLSFQLSLNEYIKP